MPAPRYFVHLRADGTIRIMRSDGDDCTVETAEWVKNVLTKSLRDKLLPENPEFRGFREKIARINGTTKRGEKFTVDPVIHELEAEKNRQGLSRSAVSQALFHRPEKMGAYTRGRARPQVELVRLWAYVLGLTLMTVPRALESQVRGMIEEWRSQQVQPELIELAKVEVEES